LETGYRLGLKPVASVAPHFATPSGYDVYRLLTAIRTNTSLDQIPAGPITAAHHLVDPEAVYERFRDLQEAVINTERLAERCRSDVLPRGQVLPPTRLPQGQDATGYLRLLCERGLSRRQAGDERAVRLRLEQELTIIRQRDLEPYFLAVQEIAEEARRQGVPMALRGSAGNSLVCFLLGITEVDPLRFGMRFERFLHAGRSDLPDIDLDFDARTRGRVLAAVVARYGADHCALVGCLQSVQPRSAFRMAAKAHGLAPAQIRQVLDVHGVQVGTLREEQFLDALAEPPRCLSLEPERWRRLLTDAHQLIGRPAEWTHHPSGIVITPQPSEDYVALQRKGRMAGTAHFDKDGIERIGLVKIDLLSNRALSAVAEARQHLTTQGDEVVSSPDEDTDPATLELLQRGETLGISQLETPAMRQLLRQLKPQGLEDLVQALGLLRPGASSGGAKETFLRRRRGIEPIRYEHSCLEPVLRKSYGVMLFEDDCLLVVHALTGLPLAEADRLRRQLCHEETAKAGTAALLAACQQNGVPRRVAEKLSGQLAKFSAYAFCKSHAVSYGLITWQATYLKAHHPLSFWTAVLNNTQGAYPRRVYMEAIKRAGVQIQLPCVNRSGRAFSQEVSAIRTGLSAVRGLDATAISSVLEEREQRGVFQGLADFRQRVTVSPGDLARLIRVGSFDFSGRSRAALLREAGIESHHTGPPSWVPGKEEDVEPWPAKWMLNYALAAQWEQEWDLLGFLVGSGMMQLCRLVLPPGLADSRMLGSMSGQKVYLAGLLASSRSWPTESGGQIHAITLEDEWGLVEVMVNTSEKTLSGMGPWMVEGVVEDRHGVPVVVADRLQTLQPGPPFPLLADKDLRQSLVEMARRMVQQLGKDEQLPMEEQPPARTPGRNGQGTPEGTYSEAV
jgi:error-prone DNA polymerase